MPKRILDSCCGSKMFWFDKNNPDVEFCDIRSVEYHEYYLGRFIEISPDTVCDFTQLPFPDNSYYLVVFDPPHLSYAGDTSIMALKYGCLKGDWRAMLTAGFNECMRVLRPNGILIFKWSEIQHSLKDIFPLFPQEPLFGNRCRKRGNTTHWLCFMKGDNDNAE
jgi:SAM-dependent methyltransferase